MTTRKLQCATADRARLARLEEAFAVSRTAADRRGDVLRLEVQRLRDRVLRVERRVRHLEMQPAPAKAY